MKFIYCFLFIIFINYVICAEYCIEKNVYFGPNDPDSKLSDAATFSDNSYASRELKKKCTFPECTIHKVSVTAGELMIEGVGVVPAGFSYFFTDKDLVVHSIGPVDLRVMCADDKITKDCPLDECFDPSSRTPSTLYTYNRPRYALYHGDNSDKSVPDFSPGRPASRSSRSSRARVLGEEGDQQPAGMSSESKAPDAAEVERRLVGFKDFVRHNPMSDRFEMKKFSHVEFWCNDATNVGARFQWALGLRFVGRSDQSTGNATYASYAYRSGDVTLVFTAPYSDDAPREGAKAPPHPGFTSADARAFSAKHGLAVRAVGVEVGDAKEAYAKCVEGGMEGVLEPVELTGEEGTGSMCMSEVKMYADGDVVLRFVEPRDYTGGPPLPGYAAVDAPPLSYGLERVDHIVSNVWKLLDAVEYMARGTGFHEYAEFTAEDVGTVDSGLNSMVMSNNSEMVLLPVNEPTYGTPRKSQILTFLEQNGGPGVQHIAMLTRDIFHTLAEMRKRTHCGGLDFMPHPGEGYYRRLPARIGDSLTEEQYKRCEELGILVDKDDQGVLLQIFTRPLGDRPTIFIEIIQRVGCEEKDEATGETFQRGGCGGFGKGNFSELFKSIEEYEKTLAV